MKELVVIVAGWRPLAVHGGVCRTDTVDGTDRRSKVLHYGLWKAYGTVHGSKKIGTVTSDKQTHKHVLDDTCQTDTLTVIAHLISPPPVRTVEPSLPCRQGIPSQYTMTA